MRNTLVLCCVAVLSAISGTASAQDWTKSKWGPNDEVGAANYMTPELVVKAASLVKTGKTYALGMAVDSKTPAYPPRDYKITIVQPGQAGSSGLGPNKATYNDDILNTWVGVGTQLDGLGHLGVEHVYYNGNKLADFADPTGLKKLGIEKVPPMVTRGVLLDMAAYFKTDVVKEGTAFNVKEIEEAAKQQNVEIRQGDVVIFHTGWLSLVGKDDKRYSAGEPGLGVEGAKYLTGKGVVAVGADTWGVEVLPFESKNVFEVHQILLAMNGTYILENLDTAALARDKGYEFLFVLGQPRWTGGVQAMINPIAIR
ncbi:polyketide cyclase [Bradyrhizobium sp. WBOS7]|jgi:kynurenine formamidase|uniref:Polyketide cyclase n=1 Tax=Bradyrhizobium betae TaxID=244734 RepID=A0AAE9NDV0_9BRAD|nr:MULTISPECIES: cyclase family protein [Bradyrhizobium]MDD1574676.1 polyketide cyclase [Bradyrhizobium sp. WBOS1]UUO37539.1 polyketide cyclase [Bradyrhizobium sp. WBOS01]MDD1531203.1 polyketide cyclase [Bradyrhizobium sp. WBOS2]MDD1580713.1 polyketide cyclase [Bradyrhizobium sp. WBOS7]MDD1604076.1 polyketide cyclase [Bradyrhizobium sp. WBOS16]